MVEVPRDWARPLLDEEELAAGVVSAGLREVDDYLQGEDQVAVEVAMERVGQVPVLALAEAPPGHGDFRAERIVVVVVSPGSWSRSVGPRGDPSLAWTKRRCGTSERGQR